MTVLDDAMAEADAHLRAGRHADALQGYRRVLEKDPAHEDALYNYAALCHALKRYDEAIAHFDRLLAVAPRDASALRSRAAGLQALGRYEEAAAGFEAALAVQPASVPALNGRAAALVALGRHQEAREYCERALAVDPNDALAHWNLSFACLVGGDFARGWAEYEWRWKWSGFTSPGMTFDEPLWLGRESLAGKTIILHAEQGLGDTLQFLRYVPLVAAKGARVWVMVQRALLPLVEGIEGADRVVTADAQLPRADFHTPLLSLPLALGTTLETVPANIPYLKVKSAAAAAWRAKLASGEKPLVGVSWKGSAAYAGDAQRSVPFAKFAPLLATPGVRFVGLGKDLNEEERRLTEGRDFVNPGADFAATAELIGALDLVITVDTAWSHWAGAIGRPFWLLLPIASHWCWLAGRTDSPWYPSARIFRQSKQGEWASVIDEVAKSLGSWRP